MRGYELAFIVNQVIKHAFAPEILVSHKDMTFSGDLDSCNEIISLQLLITGYYVY